MAAEEADRRRRSAQRSNGSDSVAVLMKESNRRRMRRYEPEQIKASDNPDDIVDLEAFGRGGVHIVRDLDQYSELEDKEVIAVATFQVQRFIYRTWNNFTYASHFFDGILDVSFRAALPDGDLFVIDKALRDRMTAAESGLDAIEKELSAMYGDAPLPKSSRTERIAVPITSSLDRKMLEFVLKADKLVSMVEGLYLAGDLGMLMQGQRNRSERIEKIVSILFTFAAYVIQKRRQIGEFITVRRRKEREEAEREAAEAAKAAELARLERERKQQRREYARQQAELRAKQILEEREAREAQTKAAQAAEAAVGAEAAEAGQTAEAAEDAGKTAVPQPRTSATEATAKEAASDPVSQKDAGAAVPPEETKETNDAKAAADTEVEAASALPDSNPEPASQKDTGSIPRVADEHEIADMTGRQADAAAVPGSEASTGLSLAGQKEAEPSVHDEAADAHAAAGKASASAADASSAADGSSESAESADSSDSSGSDIESAPDAADEHGQAGSDSADSDPASGAGIAPDSGEQQQALPSKPAQPAN